MSHALKVYIRRLFREELWADHPCGLQGNGGDLGVEAAEAGGRGGLLLPLQHGHLELPGPRLAALEPGRALGGPGGQGGAGGGLCLAQADRRHALVAPTATAV